MSTLLSHKEDSRPRNPETETFKEEIRLLDTRRNIPGQLNKSTHQSRELDWNYAEQNSFDGLYRDSTSMGFARHTAEIVLFPSSLSKLGEVSLFPSWK